MNLQYTMELLDITPSNVICKMNANINADNISVEIGNMKMKFNLNGETEGKLEIDKNTGWIISWEEDSHTSGTLSTMGPYYSTDPVPISIRETTRYQGQVP